jgi:signal transduction histidine kinase
MAANGPPEIPPDLQLVVAASRAHTQDLVMAGLLHDLNGPLNNLGLTLTLLERALASATDPATGALASRLRRYLDTLAHESARLGAWSRTAAAAVHAAEPADAPAPLASLVEAARASLRHHATLSEVRLDVVHGAHDDVSVHGAPVVRAAMLAFLAAAIALAGPGGFVQVTLARSGADALVRIVLPGARVPAEVVRALDDTALVSASSVACDIVAGRALVDSVHGRASVRDDASASTIEIALRIA